MTTRETLECRIYMAEDELYRQSGLLNRDLHDVETRLKGLNIEVHRVLCETGRMPLDLKAEAIVQALESFQAAVDVGHVKNEVGAIRAMKDLIATLERQVADRSFSAESESRRTLVGVG
jgi:hypothetical protein